MEDNNRVRKYLDNIEDDAILINSILDSIKVSNEKGEETHISHNIIRKLESMDLLRVPTIYIRRLVHELGGIDDIQDDLGRVNLLASRLCSLIQKEEAEYLLETLEIFKKEVMLCFHLLTKNTQEFKLNWDNKLAV
jgi:hypothetical protein